MGFRLRSHHLRLTLARVEHIFRRGIRTARRSVGDEAGTWLKGPGSKYKHPSDDGPKWLGGKYPFPMNPSFRPPPPISDVTRNRIYAHYMSNPSKFNIRVLSAAYGIGVKRVDAILRLKGLEKSWEKGRQMQTGFLTGMERILGTSDHVLGGAIPQTMKDVSAADVQDQDEANDHARDRYQRLFWEPIVGNEEPIVPQALEQAKDEAILARRNAARVKSDPKLLTGMEGEGAEPIRRRKPFVRVNSRSSIRFRDVGGKFLDVEDRTRRMHEAERRRGV